MKAQPKASHFIGGTFMEDKAGKTLPVIYPATGEEIAKLYSATPNVIEAAYAAALKAQGEWAALKPVERGRILRRTAEILREKNKKLSKLETLDTGKALQETLVADAASAADALEFFGGIISGFNGEFVELGGSFAYTRREHSAFASVSAHGTIRSRLPRGNPRLHSRWGMPSSSSRPKTRRFQRLHWRKHTRKRGFPMACSMSCRASAMSVPRSSIIA